MKRKIIYFLIFLVLSVPPAHSENAVDYFNRGIKSTLTNTKIKYFTKALELDPYMLEAYEHRGMLFFYQEKFDRVIHDFQAITRLDPTRAEAYRMLGMGYLKSGYYERAVDRFTRALEIEPDLISAVANRAEAYRLIGKYEETIRDATIAIRHARDGRIQSDAYRTRAKVFREMDRTDLANADVRAAWEVDPRFPIWWRYFLKSASPEEMRGMAPFMIIGILVVLILGLKLKPPEKDE
ncbi:tetratricopeptide repeat protein [Thermodesulfobacteriota bacterium]